MNPSLQIQVHKLKDLSSEIREWVLGLSAGDIVLLHGAMGAGKTTLVGALVGILGGEPAASPTYALHHQYACPKFDVDHWDLFRLENEDQLESTGFWDLLQNSSLLLIEWPERVPEKFWPRDRRTYSIEIKKGTLPESRTILIKQLW